MNSYKIGANPIRVNIHLTKPNGSSFDIGGLDLSLKYKTSRGESSATSFTVSSSENIVSWTFPKDSQKFIGNYSLLLTMKNSVDGSGICQIVMPDAFALSNDSLTNGGTTAVMSEDESVKVVDLFVCGDYYSFAPVIPSVGENDGYWYVNGTKGTPAYFAVELTNEGVFNIYKGKVGGTIIYTSNAVKDAITYGNYAKTQGDYAKAKGDQAAADMAAYGGAVHKQTNETVGGIKTFSDGIKVPTFDEITNDNNRSLAEALELKQDVLSDTDGSYGQRVKAAETGLSNEITRAQAAESALSTAVNGKVPEAPQDGKQYARKNHAWAEVVIPDDSGFVHKTGNETISGNKTFNGKIIADFGNIENSDGDTLEASLNTLEGEIDEKQDILSDTDGSYGQRVKTSETNISQLSSDITELNTKTTGITYTNSTTKIDGIDVVSGVSALEDRATALEDTRITDAPSDGKTYVRKNGSWNEGGKGISGTGTNAEVFNGGDASKASGMSSHAEGAATNASGQASHAEGVATTASGDSSHAEGINSTASGDYSHAEGSNTTASGDYSHAEGKYSKAEGESSHAEGSGTTASGTFSHAEGRVTITQNNSEHAQGQYNKSNKNSTTFGNAGNTIHSVGIGTSNVNRKNAYEIMQNGDVYIYGVGGYDGTNPNTSGIGTIQSEINQLSSQKANASDVYTKAQVDAMIVSTLNTAI